MIPEFVSTVASFVMLLSILKEARRRAREEARDNAT
jgi:hypothetical protein